MTLFKQIKSIQQSVWWLFAVLLLCSNAAWSAVGYVHEASGQVLAQRGTGPAQPVKAGDTFEPGTTFRTAGDGKVILKFEDGQLAALQPDTTFRVNQYNFIAAKPKESTSSVSLIAGAMRFVTGMIGSTNHNNVKIAAGTTATIGIRGSDFTVAVNATTQAVLAAIAAGAAVLETPSGSTALAIGQFSTFTPGTTPTQAAPITSASPAQQSLVNALAAAPLPLNNPVVIASASKAALAVAVARSAQAAANANPGNQALIEAAKTAAAAADTAIQTAVSDAQVVLQTAITNGYVQPAAPATAPAPDQTLQQVNTIINTPVLPPCNPLLASCN